MSKVELTDPSQMKMFQAFENLTLHQFWKKVKASVKPKGEKEELAEFNALYKSFNMGLGKVLDKFDKAFPDQSAMNSQVGALNKIFNEYRKKIEKSDFNKSMILDGAMDKLEAEVTRRMVWVKKYVK